MELKNRIIDEFNSFDDVKIYDLSDYQSLHENYKPSTKQKILGIVEGKSFVLDGVSRNGRFYPKKLWENALKNPEVKNMLNDKLMFGCIGHPENYTLDELLSEGKVSHIVTDIKIGKDGYGYAVYEILDTPSGRILETVLRAGSKLKVSTRGFGEFANESKEIDGKKYQVINPETFQLESIDFVIKPGIASVDVKLVEELENKNLEDIKKLKESNIHLCEDGICTLISEMELYENNLSDIKQLKEQNEKLQLIIKNLKDENDVLQNKLLEDDSNNEDENNEDKKDYYNIMVLSYIEYFLKDININKKMNDIRDKMLDYINTPMDEINNNNIDDLLKIIEETDIDNDYIKNLKEYLIKIKDLMSKKDDKNNLDDIITYSNNLISKHKTKKVEEEYTDLIESLTRKVLNNTKEKNNLLLKIKDIKENLFEISNKLKKEKKSCLMKSNKITKYENDFNELSNKYNLLSEKFEKILEEKTLLENDLHKVNVEYKILKESKIDINENEVNKKVDEKLRIIKENIKKEIEKENQLYLELKEKNIETILEKKFNNKLNSLKEKLNSIESKNKHLNNIIDEKNNELLNEKNKLNSLKEKLNSIENMSKEYKVKYLESLYKLDRSVIIETLNNYNDMNKVKNILENKQDKNKQSLTEEFGTDLIVRKEIKESKRSSLLDKLI